MSESDITRVELEIERYLVINPRAGAVPLFPSVRDPSKAVPRVVAESWPVSR